MQDRRGTIYGTRSRPAKREPNLRSTWRARGSFRRAVRSTRSASIAVLLATGAVASGCGGGDRQDKNEPSGTFNVDVVAAKFPLKQRLATSQQLVLRVRNADSRTIPDVAVTVDSFSTQEDRQDLADPNRPVWIVDDGPVGGITAYTNTWALGALRPGQTRTFRWKVTPVQSGSHRVSYRIAAGLNGKAKAQLAGGQLPEGSFAVRVSDKPSQASVDGDTGKVVPVGGSGSGSSK